MNYQLFRPRNVAVAMFVICLSAAIVATVVVRGIAQHHLTLRDSGIRAAQRAEYVEAVAASLDSAKLLDGSPVRHRLLILAEYAEQTHDVELAEATYRRLLQVDPTLHVACNNLAVVLGRRPGYVEEARTLARRAVAAAPDNREYRETLTWRNTDTILRSK